MKCGEVLEYISEYIDDMLPDKTKRAIDAHLNKCLKCRNVINTLNATLALCQELEAYKTPMSIHKDLHRMLKEEWDAIRVPVNLKYPRIMATEISINKNKMIIYIEIPGIDKKDINIISKTDKLQLTAIRNKPEGIYYINEILYGKLEKSFDLPVEINVTSIKADIKEGILEITAKIIE